MRKEIVPMRSYAVADFYPSVASVSFLSSSVNGVQRATSLVFAVLQETIEKTDAQGKLLPEMVSAWIATRLCLLQRSHLWEMPLLGIILSYRNVW